MGISLVRNINKTKSFRHVVTPDGQILPYIELFSSIYRKFSCHVCPSKFRHSSNLQKHIKTQHGDAELEKVKKYGKKGSNKCHFCDYRSNFEENLKGNILK